MSNLDKTPESLARVAKEGPHLRSDFTRAHDNAGPSEPDPGEPKIGAQQVEQDAPELNLPPPPGMSHEVDRAAHYDAASRDDARARDRYNQSTKEAFLERAAREQKQEPEHGSDRNRGRD